MGWDWWSKKRFVPYATIHLGMSAAAARDAWNFFAREAGPEDVRRNAQDGQWELWLIIDMDDGMTTYQ